MSNKKFKAKIVDPGLGPDAFRLEECDDGMMETFTVVEVLAISNFRPYLIEIDIEGFESNSFESHTDRIDFFPFVVIELQDWMLLNQFTSKNFLVEIARRKRNLSLETRICSAFQIIFFISFARKV